MEHRALCLAPHTELAVVKRLLEERFCKSRLKVRRQGQYNGRSQHRATPEDSVVCRYMLENEFGPDKPGLEEWGVDGEWPKWWRPVASVYAANLAAHKLFPDFDASYMCASLTHFSSSTTCLQISMA